MAITVTYSWKNILDKLESILETEFKGALPVYRGSSIPKGISQALQLIPSGSTILEEQDILSETREYSISIRFIFNEVNMTEATLDHVLRYASRVMTLIRKNSTMTLDKGSDADNTKAWNCRLENELFGEDEELDFNITSWEFKCSHSYIIS